MWFWRKKTLLEVAIFGAGRGADEEEQRGVALSGRVEQETVESGARAAWIAWNWRSPTKTHVTSTITCGTLLG
jgi:hypothetical protein